MITNTVPNNGLLSFVLSFESLQFFIGENSCRTPQLLYTWKESSQQHPLSQEKPGTHRLPECVTDDGMAGNSFQVSRASILNEHKD